MTQAIHPDVTALILRSRSLGADRKITNYAGGNTAAKVATEDPVTGAPATLLWVKGSGGDLGTLLLEGLAVLRIDELLGLRERYPGPEREDEMVPLIDLCRLGAEGAAPSIDTPLHAFIPAPHTDHVHPDSVIALAAAADGEALVKECYGRKVAWVRYRRPGFELALQMAALYHDNPELRGIVMGGHGLFSWGGTSEECEQNTRDLISRAAAFVAERGKPTPFGLEVRSSLQESDRRARAVSIAPMLRGLASSSKPVVGRFRDDLEVLDFLSSEAAPRLASLGTSCPDHFLRTKVRPLFLDLYGLVDDQVLLRARAGFDEYRAEYIAYYDAYRTDDSPPLRGSDPAIVLVPGVGLFSYGSDAQIARIAGDYFVNAINVMRGAEALSSYAPISDAEKFAIEYWSLEEAKLTRRPPVRALAGKVAVVTGGMWGIGRAIAERLVSEGAAVVIVDINRDNAEELVQHLGGSDHAVVVQCDVSDEQAVEAAVAHAALAFGGFDIVVNNAGLSISKPLLETTVADWDVQHRVMARGAFLVSKAVARVMIAQNRGGDIVYVVSKNALVAGEGYMAYGAAKADQAHQVRLLAAELGPYGIRVNGVNPDGVVRDSGIFAGEWGDRRAATYGVLRADLGRFYAERTLLKEEVLPTHVASAVFALVGGLLPLTTGSLIPVDGGIPAAFPR